MTRIDTAIDHGRKEKEFTFKGTKICEDYDVVLDQTERNFEI